MVDLYKRVIDGVADLGFPLSIHFEATYGVSAPAFETFAEMLDYWSPDKGYPGRSVRTVRRGVAQTPRRSDHPRRRPARPAPQEPARRDSREKLAQLAEQITAAEALIATRSAAVPTITYPDLPVSERRDEIAAAIRDHQVVVVAGETGLGQDHPAAQDLPRHSAAASAAPSGTPSRAGSPPAPSRSASPTNWAPRSATPSATPSASPTRSATARWSS